MGKLVDLTGQTFGYLKVVKRDDSKNNKKTYWECLCQCGNKISTRSDSLISGLTKSCGCLQKTIVRDNYIDLTNQKFGRLTVIKLGEQQNGKRGKVWVCNCDCGKKDIVVSSNLLLNGHTQSCGCLKRENDIKDKPDRIIDLTNKRFGRLLVVGIDTKKNGEYYWKCKCDCIKNKIISVSGTNLRSGHVQSCGCINSKGEEIISKLLWNNNINFEKQYSFDELRTETGNKMRFDFGILNNSNELLYLIEFDGIHHFQYKSDGWNDETHFIETQNRDSIKNDFCRKKNIDIVRISYLDISKISIDMLVPHKYQYLLRKDN